MSLSRNLHVSNPSTSSSLHLMLKILAFCVWWSMHELRIKQQAMGCHPSYCLNNQHWGHLLVQDIAQEGALKCQACGVHQYSSTPGTISAALSSAASTSISSPAVLPCTDLFSANTCWMQKHLEVKPTNMIPIIYNYLCWCFQGT